MKINLVIASYGGAYERKFNSYNFSEISKYLRVNLEIINSLKTNITQISVMRPKIDTHHREIQDYYDFNNVNISNIKDKIKIYECDNVGISYGQFFYGISQTQDFDYHIFIEDDYVPFKDYFELDLINQLDKVESSGSLNNKNIFMCMYYYKNGSTNIVDYFECDYYRESEYNIKYLKDMLDKYNWKLKNVIVPDFSLGILSKSSVNKIINVFGSFDNVKDFFNMKLGKIELHQILFGVLLDMCGIQVKDTSETFLNIFFQSYNSSILLCNWDVSEEVSKWRELNPSKKFDIPLFIPINILYPNNYENDINIIHKYVLNWEQFKERFMFINKIKQNI